jgi:hypothetical protein
MRQTGKMLQIACDSISPRMVSVFVTERLHPSVEASLKNLVPYLIFLIRKTFFKKNRRKIVLSVISFCSLDVLLMNKEEIEEVK